MLELSFFNRKSQKQNKYHTNEIGLLELMLKTKGELQKRPKVYRHGTNASLVTTLTTTMETWFDSSHLLVSKCYNLNSSGIISKRGYLCGQYTQ